MLADRVRAGACNPLAGLRPVDADSEFPRIIPASNIQPSKEPRVADMTNGQSQVHDRPLPFAAASSMASASRCRAKTKASGGANAGQPRATETFSRGDAAPKAGSILEEVIARLLDP